MNVKVNNDTMIEFKRMFQKGLHSIVPSSIPTMPAFFHPLAIISAPFWVVKNMSTNHWA